MEEFYVGNNFIGNFNAQDDIDKRVNYRVEKRHGSLYLVNGNEMIRLISKDSNGELIVDLFDESISEENSSIYWLRLDDDNVIICFYVYQDVKKLLHNDEQMNIYVDRAVERELCTDERYKEYNIKKASDIPGFMKSQFMNNRSIFVHESKKDKNNPNRFQMFGKDFRVQVDRERNGVYKISRFMRTQNKEFSFELTQLFGKINFVTFNDSISIETTNATPFSFVRPNEIFKTWNEYMDFKQQTYNDDLMEFNIIHYNNFKIVNVAGSDLIVFSLSDGTDISILENKNIEYEMISSYYDDLPKTVEDLLSFKSNRKNKYKIRFLGKCFNDDYSVNTMAFKWSEKIDGSWKNHGGIIYVSDFSLSVEKKRRDDVSREIDSKQNLSANIILKLSDSNVKDETLGRDRNPVNDRVLRKMFGKPINLRENYREAMSIALNTPDIALIQGPPGTGKTTLIKGLVARLNELGDNIKILVSSEQHEALYNVVDRLSVNKLIPPYISSIQQNDDSTEEDQEKRERTARIFQKEFTDLCNIILHENKDKNEYDNSLTNIVYLFKSIRDEKYSTNKIREIWEDLTQLLISMALMEHVKVEYNKVNEALFRTVSRTNTNLDYKYKLLVNKINSQRTDINAFLDDDGIAQMEDLQEKFEKYGYEEYKMKSTLFKALISNDVATIKSKFDDYITYVESLRDKFIPKAHNDLDVYEPFDKLVEALYDKIVEVTKKHTRNFFDIVNDLKYRLNDLDNVNEVIKEYTSVIGSTCAQAKRSQEYLGLSSADPKYDYVIVDEAARANPLDIMIPMMLGINVILIGDHKQLPHYIETDVAKRFSNNKNKYKAFDEKLLKKSLFQVMFENLDKAHKDGRLKFKRTITINEQHRMHPTIGNFISNEFYNGEIINGEKTINNTNDYHILDGKNIAWLNVPSYEGLEESFESSKCRVAEIKRIISFISELLKKNVGRTLDIGIITFYSGQVELLQQAIRHNYSSDVCEHISINTIDSYQGKEFDIAIISGVRCNDYSTPEKSLGFIHLSESRVNVALSRGKRLLVMVGDKDTFSRTPHFKNFIEYVKREGYYDNF